MPENDAAGKAFSQAEHGQNAGEKVFSQAELDHIIQERLSRERAKKPPQEAWDAFIAWQAEGSAVERARAEKEAAAEAALSAAQAAAAQAGEELATYRRRDAVRSAGVAEGYVDYVCYAVQKAGGEFEQALPAFLAENAHYTREVVIDTGPPPDAVAQPGGMSLLFSGVRPKG